MKTPFVLTTISCYIAGAILLTGCTEDPGSPDGTEPHLPVATADIGPQGGILAAADFHLAVPGGAFTSTVTLILYREPGIDSFHPQEPATVWRVEGLPHDYRSELSVRLLRTGTITPAPLVAMGEEVFVRSLGATRLGWRIHEAENQGDWTILQLPVLPTAGKDEPFEVKQSSLRFSLTEGLATHTTPANHFRIRYHEDLVTGQQAVALGTYLEEAYDDLLGLGFDYAGRTRWPVDVTMTRFDSAPVGATGFAADSFLGDDFGWLEFDIQSLNDSSTLRLAAGHEMCHLVQGLHDPRPAIIQAAQPAVHSWLDEAVAVWSEELFTDDSAYRPLSWQAHNLQPLVGLQAGAMVPTGSVDAAITARNHGYGMAALVKYITQRWDKTRLPLIYQHIALGTHPVLAIEEGVGEPLSSWWDVFLRSYITGAVYDLSWETILASSSAQITVQSRADTASSHTFDYPDLSGRIFHIDLAYPDLDTSAEMQLHSDGGAYIISAYSFGDGEDPLLLGHAPFVLSIPNLRQMTFAERDVLILLTNNRREAPTFDGNSQITLSSRIRDHIDLPAFDAGSFSFRFDAHWQDALGDTWVTTDYDLRLAVAQGQFSGTTFFAQWDSTSVAGVHHLGEFSVELDPHSLTVIRWEVFSRTDFSESDTFEFFNCSGGGIPLSIQQDDFLEYGISGAGTCRPGPVERVYAIQVNHGVIVQQLSDFTCDEGSFVDLVLEVREIR